MKRNEVETRKLEVIREAEATYGITLSWRKKRLNTIIKVEIVKKRREQGGNVAVSI